MQAHNTHTLSDMRHSAENAEALLKQLANSNRLMVLCSLTEGEKTVSQLLESVDLSQSALSQHLSKLREAGLVSATKRGQHVVYRICSMQAQAILSVLYCMYCSNA